MTQILWLLRLPRDLRDIKLSGVGETQIFKEKVSLNYIEDKLVSEDFVIAKTGIVLNYFSKQVANLFAFCRLWRNRERTILYYIRANSFFSLPWENPLFYDTVINGKSSSNLKIALIVRFWALAFPFWILERAFVGITYLEYLRNYRFMRQFKILVMPYQGLLDGQFDLLLSLAKSTGLITFVIQSNWDNFCTKNFLYSNPTFFGVWGEQSKYHLLTIQRKTNCSIVLLGNPRRRSAPLSHNEKSYRQRRLLSVDPKSVVFAGHGAVDFDFQYLQCLIEIRKQLASNFTIVYRPHPFARFKLDNAQLTFLSKNNITIVDENSGISSDNFFATLKESSILISQMSTLCIESLEMGVPVSVPTFLTSGSSFGFEESVNSAPHFSGLRVITGLSVAPDKQALLKQIFSALNTEVITGDTEWICSSANFADTLNSKLDEILNSLSKN